jgi:hypothetical protein
MPLEIALWTLLHSLVFVYWLGGDLGAFYASAYLTRPGISADRRLMAGKIVADVDMAPRTALIMAAPTGYALAVRSDWIHAPAWTVWLVLAAGLAWLALAWKIHLSHGAAGTAFRTTDLYIRWLFLAGLALAGVSGLAGLVELPGFIAIKLLLLAAAVLMGLLIRGALKPLGPALAGLSGPDPGAAEASLARMLNMAKPLVVVIWALIILAAFTGLLKPTI